MKQQTVALKHFLEMIREAFALQENSHDLDYVSVSKRGDFLVMEVKNLSISAFTESEKEFEYIFQGLVQAKFENCTFNHNVVMKGLCNLEIVCSDFRHQLDISFSVNELEPALEIRESAVGILCFPAGSCVYSCCLTNTKFQELSFLGVTAGEGGIFFEKIEVAEELNLAFEKNPPVIHCDWEMAEHIHYAAPTVPLVMTKKKE
jgi:hypothetical protein